MSFSLNEIGAKAADRVAQEIENRKKSGASKLSREQAEQIAVKTATDAFTVTEENIQVLLRYIPDLFSKPTSRNETVGHAIHRIVVDEALKDWTSKIGGNVARQYAPYQIADILDVVPKALNYCNALRKRNMFETDMDLREAWLGLALMYLEDRTPERLIELGDDTEMRMLSSLAREIDTLAWMIKETGVNSKKARLFHERLFELKEVLYMISQGDIDLVEVSWPPQTN